MRGMMLWLSAGTALLLSAAPSEKPAIVVQAPDSPVRLEHVAVLRATAGPPVVLYAATNLTEQPLEQFTVLAFTFGPDGTLKARQTAPGRRSLEGHETKYSTLVLDGSPLAPDDVLVLGVNQAQRVGSEAWWRADLQAAAQAAAQTRKE